MPVLYNLRTTSTGFLIAKFDSDFNVEAVYELTGSKDKLEGDCTCPAGLRPSCKHRKMLHRMVPKADTEHFYCYETQSWHTPLAPPGVEPMAEKLDGFYATLEEFIAPNQPTADLAPTGGSQATGPNTPNDIELTAHSEFTPVTVAASTTGIRRRV